MAIIEFKLNGRYVIEKELGRGGLGIVYLARDTYLQSRPVVIKTMREAQDGAFDDSWIRKKFDGEITALLQIKHPGVVGISDVGFMRDGRPFFVMQYIEGENLRSAMHDQEMELKRAAHIILQLSQALSAAHEMGVIHRDLKPENVMLQKFRSGQEVTYLIDFGIATVKELRAGQHEQSTEVAGTLPYMAPEQLDGGPVPASDVWALGVVAYEMVTGRLPFPADNSVALHSMQQAGVSAKPRALRPQLPEAAQRVILKTLSYDPAQRYAHAHEMGEHFHRAILGNGAPTLPMPDDSTRKATLPASPPPEELLWHCRELFESFKEFRNQDNLWDFFYSAELSPYKHCVSKSANIDYDQLLACLSRSGRNYRGQALLDVLAMLASRYRDDYRGQECEGLRGSFRQLFVQSPVTGK
jgi:serine/threonine-protein kinase